MELGDLQSLNLDAIQDGLCVVAAGHPMSAMGEDMQSLSEAFEARAIYHLLLNLDLPAYAMNLQRGAQTRRYFLRKSRQQRSADTVFVALSRTNALFDCIAGGDWRLATDIAALSPQGWMREGEYYEDYCYQALLHAYVASAVNGTDLAPAHGWRQRLETAVVDIPGSAIDVVRLEVCTAFLAADDRAFWKAFGDLAEISNETAASVPLADGRLFEFPWLGANRHVSIELVAWISLAQTRGMTPPEPEYVRCPSAAWLRGAVPPARDIFLEMETQFGL